MSFVFIDNKFVAEDEARVPVTDRGFLFGDGVFTSLRVNNGRVECYQAHLERLRKHCEILQIIPPKINTEDIVELFKLNKAHEGIWKFKIIVTGGEYDDGLALVLRPAGQLIMLLKPYDGTYQASYRLCLYPNPLVHPLA